MKKAKKHGATATDVLRQLKMKKHLVRDDGRCWIYVIMATLKLYNTRLKRGKAICPDPLPTELVTAQNLCMSISDEFPNVEKGPDYENKRESGDFFGEYGGLSEWQALCEKIDNLSFVLWDPRSTKKMDDPDATFDTITRIQGKGVLKRRTPRQILDWLTTLQQASVVHAAWSNTIESHFDVYLPS